MGSATDRQCLYSMPHSSSHLAGSGATHSINGRTWALAQALQSPPLLREQRLCGLVLRSRGNRSLCGICGICCLAALLSGVPCELLVDVHLRLNPTNMNGTV